MSLTESTRPPERLAIPRMVWREASHNRVNFGLGVFAVGAAAACLVAAQAQVQTDRLVTTRVLDAAEGELAASIAEKQSEVDEAGKQLQDTIPSRCSVWDSIS